MSRPTAITGLAVIYFLSAAGIVLFVLTDFTDVVPLAMKIGFSLVAVLQCFVGRGLWRTENWARVVTIVLSAFFMFPVIVKLFLAFRSVNVVQFLLSLSFVTFQGMIIAYLVAADTRRAFEVPLAELRLKDGQ